MPNTYISVRYVYIYPVRVHSCNSCGSITNRFNESHMQLGLLCYDCQRYANSRIVSCICQSVRQTIRLPVRLSICLSVALSLWLSPNARSSLMFSRYLTTHLARANKVCLIDLHLMLFISLWEYIYIFPPLCLHSTICIYSAIIPLMSTSNQANSVISFSLCARFHTPKTQLQICAISVV